MENEKKTFTDSPILWIQIYLKFVLDQRDL